MTIAPTLTLGEATRRTWPVVVVGAGPAGTVAARDLARRDVAVLLVDRASFPRPKVCGSCLNEAALAVLAGVGLSELPVRLGAVPLRSISVRAAGRTAALPLSGVAVSREVLDAALVGEAVAAGAHFLPLTSAVLLPETGAEARPLLLRQGGEEARATASIVLAANGLGGAPGQVEAGSRIGVGAVVETEEPFYHQGEVVMCCGAGGYVGTVRLEDGRLDVACAADAGAVRAAGGPAALVARLLRANGCPVPDTLLSAPWRGTPPLTRRATRLSTHRLLAVGDAAGYVEPFTGEGIAWALASAVSVADLAAGPWRPSIPAEWARRHRLLVTSRQRVCRAAAAVLRRPALAACAVAALAWLPALALPVIRRLNQAPRGVR